MKKWIILDTEIGIEITRFWFKRNAVECCKEWNQHVRLRYSYEGRQWSGKYIVIDKNSLYNPL